MSKKLLVIGMILILLVVVLMGCTGNIRENDRDEDGISDSIDVFPDDKNEWIDSDGDGYGNNGDDFPIDSNLHLKEGVNEIKKFHGNYTIEPSQGSGFGSKPDISSDWKYVIVNWEITKPLGITIDQQEEIELEIRNPSTSPQELYYYSDYSSRNLRFTINDDNWGEWEFSFRNTLSEEEYGHNEVTVTIHYEIYKIK